MKSEVYVSRRVTLNIFGQRQLGELASSGALREFLARGLADDWTAQLETQRLLVRDLESNAAALASKETALTDLEDKAAERSDYVERIERARAAGADKVIAKLQGLSRDNQKYRRAQQWPGTASDALQKVAELLPPPTPPNDPPDMAELGRSLTDAGAAISQALDDATDAVVKSSDAVKTARAVWLEHYERQKAVLEGELAAVGISNPADLAAWQGRLSELDDELSALPTARSSRSALLKQREELLTRLRAGWRAKSRLIEQAAARVATLLPPRVRLVTGTLRDRTAFRTALERAVQGQGVRSEQLDKLSVLDPSTVLKAAETGVDELVSLGVTANTAAKLAAISPTERRSIELAEIQDEVTVEMDPSPGGTGEWRNIGDVSPGQRATALLALVLVGGHEPLIIDQPEDDLDNRYIYEEVVGVLGRTCEKRQVIVATHNANIPILGDAELIVALDASATRSKVIAMGGLELSNVADSARTILEGGEEAFLARSQRYLGTRT